MRKGFCLLGLLFCFALASAQVVLPTFGVRGEVPEDLLKAFMTQLKQDIESLGITTVESELITPGIAGSLEPTVAYLAADYEGARYAILGEIQENRPDYTVNILIGDAKEKRPSDIISEPLDPTQIVTTSSNLAQNISDFLGLEAPLEGSAALFVRSEPTGATLLVDGVERGQTGSIINLQPGWHTVEVRLEGYLPQEQRIELKEELGVQFLPFILDRSAGGSLLVYSAPIAEVFIDDISKGFTPLTVSALPGTHLVRLQRPGFIPAESEPLVKENRVSRVKTILTPQFDRMVYWEIQNAPLLMLDGIVQTSSYAELSVGEHTVEVLKDGKKIVFNFVMPEKGVFALDIDNQMLIPHPE